MADHSGVDESITQRLDDIIAHLARLFETKAVRTAFLQDGNSVIAERLGVNINFRRVGAGGTL